MALGHNRLDAIPIFVEWHTKIVVNVRTIKRLYVCGQHRLLLHKDRRKPFWTFTINFEEAQAFRKANGGYLRKNQWEDLTVDVYSKYKYTSVSDRTGIKAMLNPNDYLRQEMPGKRLKNKMRE